jgi:K+-transporting ATPase ATPase C chain
MTGLRKDLIAATIAIVLLTLLLGVAYPLLTTGVSQVLFPNAANGSKVEVDGKVVGSKLIGQDFRGLPRYFQGRPSATEYSADVTYFNNLGPNNRELSEFFRKELTGYLSRERRYDPGLTAAEVPVDAVTTSASGVDPQISEANARIQAHRVAAVRGLPLRRVLDLVSANTEGRSLALFGEPGVNVLELNLALDKTPPTGPKAEPRGAFLGGDDRRDAAQRAPLALRPRDRAAGRPRLVGQARPSPSDPQPGDARGRDRRGDHHRRLVDPGLRRPAARRRQRSRLVCLLDRRLALAHGDLRQLRRGAGRGARQGAGRCPARDADGNGRAPARRW